MYLETCKVINNNTKHNIQENDINQYKPSQIKNKSYKVFFPVFITY